MGEANRRRRELQAGKLDFRIAYSTQRMIHHFGKLIIVSLGGSIICPEDIDWKYLKEFKRFVHQWLRRGKRFFIVPGGGRISRKYQEAAAKAHKITNEDKDWIGIHATRLNAHLLRTVFREFADPIVFDSRHKFRKLRYPVTIASGWRPGWSTDYVSTVLAVDFGVGEVINASVVPYVYDKNIMQHEDAKPIMDITWREYRKLVPSRWIPGAHYPIDPIAARLADREGITFIAIDGRNLKNFNNVIAEKDFHGSIIR